jgi:hypothetical protein
MHLLLGASDFWATRWLTSFWLVGCGIAIGFGVLTVLLVLFAILSTLPGLNRLRKTGTAHWAAAVVALVLGGGLALWLRGIYVGSGGADARTDEWAMVSLAGLFAMALLSWSFFYCSNPRLISELRSVLFQGAGAYALTALAAFGAIGLLSFWLIDQPFQSLRSLPQLLSSGKSVVTLPVPGIDPNATEAKLIPLDIRYDARLLESVRIESDRNVVIGDAENLADFRMIPVRIDARSEVNWTRKRDPHTLKVNPALLPPLKAPLPMNPGDRVFVQNTDIDAATLRLTLITRPEVPEVSTVVISALTVVGLGLILLLQQGMAPQASAIALTTAKSEIAQPLFLLLTLIGALVILASVFLPFHTMGEDIKLLKDCGITIILVLSLFQGVWSASSSVSEEIEGRTALTVLSKPVNRRSFLIGKMMGVFWILALMFLILGAELLLAVGYKAIYEAKENSEEMPIWQICHMEILGTLPGLAMAFLQSFTLSSFSVAIATRLPQFANFAVCLTIYLVGHMTESLVGSAEGGFPILQFIGQLIAVIVPDLEHFSMQAAIDAGNPIPLAYLSGTLIYAVLYLCLSILLGLLLFEDRDLA